MNLFSTRLDRYALRRGLAAACGLLAMAGSATPARGQCSPQELAKLVASDAAASDFFGNSVAVSGDTAVVGVYNDDHAGGDDAGAAFVFLHSGTTWTQQAKLSASDAATFDYFGVSVAVSGDTAVVGAYRDDHAGGIDAGSAYVFVRSGGTWTQQAKLVASDAAASDFFGNSVAVSGDTVVVGAYIDNLASLTDAGSAYVFVRTGGVWTQQAKLTASDAGADDNFGWSVAVSGDTAVVGAWLDNLASLTDAGSAYIFVRSGVVWTQQAKLTTSDAAASDNFGVSVAIHGETVVVGAYGDDLTGVPNAGSAFVFVRSTGGVWSQQTKLIATDAADDGFGVSVAVDGGTVVVGANGDDDAGNASGSAYVFVRSGGGWLQQNKLTASDAAVGDNFGVSVAIHSETAVIGAQFDNPVGPGSVFFGQGSAYVFALGCDDDGDGVINVNDICPNTPPGLPVDCDGRPLRDCNNDCNVDGLDVQCIVAELLGA